MPAATLIISVYDKAKELDLILTALTVQNFKDFEVIIAEDGQSRGIRELADNWKSKSHLLISHITQEDSGFRKNKILNEAIRNSGSDYLVFIDGDCIPHPDFMKAHIENKVQDTVLCGRRVNLTESISKKISRESILNLNYSRIKLSEVLFSAYNKKRNEFNFNIEEGFIIKNKKLRSILMNEDEHILGCNFSVHKNVLEKINGFDENYEGPGLGEDSDIEYRMRLIGVKFRSIRNLAVQYHIYHPKTIESDKNMEYYRKVTASKEYFCKNGLVKSEK